jgi:hypothetical protein
MALSHLLGGGLLAVVARRRVERLHARGGLLVEAPFVLSPSCLLLDHRADVGGHRKTSRSSSSVRALKQLSATWAKVSRPTMSAVRKAALLGRPIGVPTMRRRPRGEPVGQHLVDGGHHGVGADAVADEVGGVLRDDDALAQHVGAEALDAREGRGVGLGAGHELEELHVPRRVEEVDDHEALAKRRAAAFEHGGDAQPGGVARHEGGRAREGLELREEGALDVDVLDDGLDDEVDGADASRGRRRSCRRAPARRGTGA